MSPEVVTHLASTFGRNPCPQFASSNDGSGKNNCSCSHHSLFANDGMVHHDRPHPDERSSLHMGSMNDGVVSDADVILEHGMTFFKGAMNDGAVLNVDAFSNFDWCNISSDHSAKPNGALCRHFHVTDDSSVGGEPNRFVQLWMKITHGEYCSHALKVHLTVSREA